jgi:hypothetical protein
VSASYSAKIQAWNDRVLTVPANRADLQIPLHPASHRVFTGARKWNEGSIPLVFREERRREIYCTNEDCKRPGGEAVTEKGKISCLPGIDSKRYEAKS